MAIIIQKGRNQQKLATCKDCECVFLYSPYETFKFRKHYYIRYPDCLCANILEEKSDKTIIMEDHDNGN